MRNRDTPMYLSLLYFFFIAFNFRVGLETFCRAMHIYLKHFIKVYFST
jgi:hypothetical protein